MFEKIRNMVRYLSERKEEKLYYRSKCIFYSTLYMYLRDLYYMFYNHSRSQMDVQMSGMRFTVNSQNFYFWNKINKNIWETQALQILPNKIGVGDTFVDVGGWIGPYTLLAAKCCRQLGAVHTFEPDPAAREILKQNISLNNLDDIVKVYSSALSDKVGELEIGPRRGNFGNSMSSILESEWEREPITVPSTTLEDFISKKGISPNLIKIDIEGAEYDLFKGGEEYIVSERPNLLIEVHKNLLSNAELQYIVQILSTYDSITHLEYPLSKKIQPKDIFSLGGNLNLLAEN